MNAVVAARVDALLASPPDSSDQRSRLEGAIRRLIVGDLSQHRERLESNGLQEDFPNVDRLSFERIASEGLAVLSDEDLLAFAVDPDLLDGFRMFLFEQLKMRAVAPEWYRFLHEEGLRLVRFHSTSSALWASSVI